MKDKVITIVGGGASAVALIGSILDKVSKYERTERLKIFVIEKRSQLGPGAAYAEDADSNLLNTRAGFITPFVNKPGDFYEWLSGNRALWEDDFPQISLSADGFLPRPLFGKYLSHTFQRLRNRAVSLGCEIVPINGEATALSFTHDGRIVVTAEGSIAFPSDHVVLSCGNGATREFAHLEDKPGFLPSPYPIKRLARRIDQDARVAVIGTRLSAIDAVLGLNKSGHRGPITMHSRHGALPSVRGTQGRYEPTILTLAFVQRHVAQHGAIRLDEAIKWIGREMVAAGVTERPTDLTALCRQPVPAEFLAREIKASEGPRPWQAVLYATNAVIDFIWSNMPDEERRKFWPYMSWWMAYRVSIPAENAIKLLDRMEARRLDVYSGPIDVSHDGRCFQVEVSSQSEICRFAYDAVVVGTGTPRDVRQIECPLVQRLLSEGIATPHGFGGVQIAEATGALIDAQGVADERITVLGELTSGAYFFTSVLEINARHAHRRAETILQRLTPQQAETPWPSRIRLSA